MCAGRIILWVDTEKFIKPENKLMEIENRLKATLEAEARKHVSSVCRQIEFCVSIC